MKNYAYVTLITHNDYMAPAMVLAHQWKAVQSKYPLYIMITSDITIKNQDILEILGYKMIMIDEFIPRNYLKIFNSSDIAWQTDRHGKQLNQIGWVHTFNKIKVWELTQFDKVCFLDLDLFIIQNLDTVFDYDEFTCAWSEGLTQVCSQIFIAEPNIIKYNKFCDFANNYVIPYERYQLNNVLYTDEDLFTDFFKIKQWLPQYFDCQSLHFNITSNCYPKYDLNKIKAVHFTTRAKPWLNGKEFTYSLNPETEYMYIYYWNWYVDIYNNILNTLQQKGINYEKI